MDLIPIYIIAIPIITAIIVYISKSKIVNYCVFASQIILTCLVINYYGFLSEKSVHILQIGGWHHNIGIALRNDLLSFSFISLSIFSWWIVLIYDWRQRKNDSVFLFFLMFLQGVFLGLIQSNDLFNFFVFIEITTIISSILIIFKKDGFSLRAGFYYLLFNSVGILLYLIGLIVVYKTTGTLNMIAIREALEIIKGENLIVVAYVFFMVSMGVKSAFLPVYTWSPRAHGAAPHSISALLSGLLVKSGLYGFIRLNEMFNLHDFTVFFMVLGFVTAILGVIFAICQNDIKQMLAFSTSIHVGLILIGISELENTMYNGGVVHMFNHVLVKLSLFMAAGIVIKEFKSSEIAKIKGVFKRLPVTSFFFIIGMIIIMGAPFSTIGMSKSMIEGGFRDNHIAVIVHNIISIGSIVIYIKMSKIFFGSEERTKKRYLLENISLALVIVAIIVAGLGLTWQSNSFATKAINIDLKLSFLKFFANFFFAYLIYYFIASKDFEIIKKIRRFDISFQNANILLVVFVFLMMMHSIILK
ncbi:MAG: complex I subunit 5 family protein [Alkaliphilus sp.]